ncbi:hypothetical protein [Dactylosporangium sp. NPDC000521]|uniref:hypothetical protein n=1 Tax=Dactylosporangium sp. NPDC000521 TaxID=3363975 RepID=UPI0036B20DD0
MKGLVGAPDDLVRGLHTVPPDQPGGERLAVRVTSRSRSRIRAASGGAAPARSTPNSSPP